VCVFLLHMHNITITHSHTSDKYVLGSTPEWNYQLGLSVCLSRFACLLLLSLALLLLVPGSTPEPNRFVYDYVSEQ
jgi:hypothetical protein